MKAAFEQGVVKAKYKMGQYVIVNQRAIANEPQICNHKHSKRKSASPYRNTHLLHAGFASVTVKIMGEVPINILSSGQGHG